MIYIRNIINIIDVHIKFSNQSDVKHFCCKNGRLKRIVTTLSFTNCYLQIMESGSGGHNSEEQPAGEGNINRIHSPTTECGFNGLALSPSTLLGRTMSASAVDYKGKWRNKKVHSTDEKSTPHPQSPLTSNDSSISAVPPLIGTKRKFSSHECSSTSDFSGLPKFVNSLPNSINSQMLRPMPTILAISSASPEFVPPTQPMRQSRPNSPSTANTRPVLPRGRVASIRRESDCSTENEAAHEKLVKSAQQVSVGFEDFCLDDKLVEERKRAKSLTEPISIFTSAFLPQSSSPSPTRSNVDTLKQCYSPSAQQVVRNNIPYSPSPSPTPGSPYHRMRSMSPITVRQISKRRYTGSGGCGNASNNGNGSGLESDGESSASSYAPPASKRQCTTPRTNCSGSSPLVRDNLNMQQFTVANLVDIPSSGRNDHYSVSSPIATGIFPNASSSSNSPIVRAQLLVDPKIAAQCINPLEVPEDDDSMVAEEEGPLVSSFCSGYDANSSTTFSSRANTPHSELLENSGTENDISSLLLPPQSSCSSDGSSQCSSSAAKIVSNNNNSNTTQQPENQQ